MPQPQPWCGMARPVAPEEGGSRRYWKTIQEDFHWHLEILPQLIGLTGFERASWFFYNSVPPETAARCLSC